MRNNNIIPIDQIGFPINFENIIHHDDSVRMLYDVTEGLYYTELNLSLIHICIVRKSYHIHSFKY